MGPGILSLPARLGGGSGLISAWVSMPDPIVVAHLAQEEFDCIVLDLQHGQMEFNAAVLAIAEAALRGIPVVVRVPVGGFALASRLLDVGAAGIIAPMINTVAEARALVAFTKYQPLGERSWSPALALALTGKPAADYLKAANTGTLAIPMIETASALAALDDILAVEGIGGVFLGPYDLSIALSGGAAINPLMPEVIDALGRVVERCRAHGKAALVMGGSGERARELIDMGFDLAAIGPDNIQLREGARAMLKAARTAPSAAPKIPYA